MSEINNNIQSTNLLKRYLENQPLKSLESVSHVKNEPIKDTIELSTKKNKNNKKALLFGGLATVAAITISAIVKKKIDSKSVIDLAKEIKFEPAKSIKEAKEFGKRNLGIKSYLGFKKEDLDILNWINEGITITHNASKGKLKLPKFVVATKNEISEKAGMFSDVEGFFGKIINGTLTVNRNYYRNVDNALSENFEYLRKAGLIKVLDDGTLNFSSIVDTKSSKKFITALHTTTGKNLSLNEKLAINETIDNLINTIAMIETSPMPVLRKLVKPEKLSEMDNILEGKTIEEQREILKRLIAPYLREGKLKVETSEVSAFSTIFHEIGHLNDKIKRAPAIDKFKSEAEYPMELVEWLSNSNNIQIANSISSYAETGPGEFIAETFAKIVEGRKIPDKTMELYKKMGGPEF